MGQALYAAEPVFRATVDACDAVARELGVPIAEAFRDGVDAPEDSRDARRSELLRLGVIQLALCDLWAAAGIEPDATLSVSLGEVPACYPSGVLTRDEVVALLCVGGRVSAHQVGEGFLLTLDADAPTVLKLCRAAPRRLDFVGTTGPARSIAYTTVEDVEQNGAFLAGRGLEAGRVPTAWAFHTRRWAPELRNVEDELAHLRPQRARIPVFSAMGGRDIAPDATFDLAHWHWLQTHPFWYAEATADALRHGPALIINIAAHPVSTPWISRTASHLGVDPVIVDSMRKDHETEAWREARATLARARVGARARARRQTENGGALAPGPRGVDAADLDLASPEVVRDPFPYLEALQRDGPVHRLPRHEAWLVVGDREVREALGHPEQFSSVVMAALDPGVIGADPPAHTGARLALSSRFAPAVLADLGALSAEAADASLASLAGVAELDVVGDFAAPLGERIAGRLLGLDEERAARVRASVGDAERGTPELVPLVARALAEVLPDPSSLDRLVWIAATTTTKRVITAAVMLLLDDPALRSRITADPTLLPALIEETGRLHPPELLVPRLTTVEVTLGGARIPRGAFVQLSIGAANRDPARFPEPERVDLARRTAHLAFGDGPHRCAGRRLARIEARAALAALLERMPDFYAPQPACTRRWIPSAGTHGVEQLVIAPGDITPE
jgi:cytochrome P450